MDKTIDGVPHIPLQNAAAMLKTTALRALMLLRNGSLQGVELDGEWYLSRESLLVCKKDGSLDEKIGNCHLSCGAHGCGCPGGE